MDARLGQRLALAQIEARRRGHPGVEPEHLLAVIIDTPEVTEALRQRGLDPLELRERLDAHLSAEPTRGGYRDANELPTSPSLHRATERLAGRRWRWLGARVSYVDALMLEPSVAALVFALRRGNDHRHILERAVALAVMSAHASVGLEHAFRALVDLRSFVDTLERAGGNVAGLEGALDTALARHAPSASASASHGPPPIGPVLRRVIAAATDMAKRSGAPLASVRQLCLELARQEEAEPLWAAAGIDHSAFVRAVHLPGATRLPLT
jgi:ATP-dependent Clp protease ATP-binding subunit ClpA